MTNNRIAEALEETNRWWKGGLRLDYKEREIYHKIKKFAATKQILALTGLRRVGKTTLMLKMILDKIEAGLDKGHIVYFSFDDFRDVKIKDVITAYARLMDKDLNVGDYLFLFDEVQKVEGWEEQVKRIYDNNTNFKIIVSGSESLFIRKKTRESLAGRFFEFTVKPLSFNEFLHFKDMEIRNTELYKEELIKAFRDYLLCSGFPEIINSDSEIREKYIKENIIEKIIYRDIPQLFPVKNPAILENIFNIILYEPGQMINLHSLASDLNIARQTASLYINYLEKSFLIKKIYNFSKNARKTEKKLKKYYPAVISSRVKELGKVLETAMVLQLDAEFFWRDSYKNEVDIVLTGDKITPIEVKSGNKIEIKGLLVFMEKFNIKKGLVISFDQEKIIEGKNVEIIPAYKFLTEER